MRIFDGGSNTPLVDAICEELNVAKGRMELIRFANGEYSTMINESIRGKDVFIVQTSTPPVHDHLMSMLIMVDAMRRASARRIVLVIPHFPYARQDKKTRGREPISAKLVANMITTAGADKVVMLDLHTAAIQGFFDIPTDHLTASPLLARYFQRKRLESPVVVSPDAGGVSRAREFARRLKAPLAILDKRRIGPNKAETYHVIGDVDGCNCILIDDMIDTAGTMCNGVTILRRHGARGVYLCATHALFSGPAVERLKNVEIEEIVVTDTVPVAGASELENLKVLSVARILAEAILRIHRDLSVSELFV